eukprot:2673315-Pyramimonas_sp.AAC.1
MGRCNFRARFDPSKAGPAIACRKARRHDLKELPSSAEDRRRFPDEVRRQLSTQWRASAAEALIKASDPQDDVWHLWLRTEEGEEGPHGTAAAGCTDKDAANLGALSFLIDTGCGYNLIAERY